MDDFKELAKKSDELRKNSDSLSEKAYHARGHGSRGQNKGRQNNKSRGTSQAGSSDNKMSSKSREGRNASHTRFKRTHEEKSDNASKYGKRKYRRPLRC